MNELFEEWKQFLSWCYENNDKTVEIHRDKLKWVMDYITNLQGRIDKAISLLKEAGCYDEETKEFCDDVWEELPDLLNILQGEDTKESEVK